MNTRQILSILILMLGLMAAILPSKKTEYLKWTEQELQVEVLKDAYYVSVDELADLLINGDPSIQLIDIRSKNVADTLLPRAVNIPIDSLLNENFEGLFDQDLRKNILYAGQESSTMEAWIRLKLKGYPNIYMLEGGLDSWNTNILNPQHPGLSASKEELDLYSSRSAAKMYFTGAKALPKTEFKIILPQGGKKKRRVEGGCS
ncbi:MAG: rhodanese-like domain-containing protein [Cyclobacteriaceae bacterium]